jgi:SAM-dependent methyltransferase
MAGEAPKRRGTVGHADDTGHAHRARPFDPDRLLAMEERRRTFLDPDRFLASVLPQDDHVLADLGCGVGFFTIPAARRLRRGRVIAVDLDPAMLETVRRRAQEARVDNVDLVRAHLADTGLAPASVDRVLLCHVLHDVEDKERALAEARRILRPEGALDLVEWKPEPSEFGPPVEIRLAPEALVALLEANAFRVERLEPGPGPVYWVSARPEVAAGSLLP